MYFWFKGGNIMFKLSTLIKVIFVSSFMCEPAICFAFAAPSAGSRNFNLIQVTRSPLSSKFGYVLVVSGIAGLSLAARLKKASRRVHINRSHRNSTMLPVKTLRRTHASILHAADNNSCRRQPVLRPNFSSEFVTSEIQHFQVLV